MPWVALAVGTELLIRVGGFLLVLAVAAAVVWMLRPPHEARRSDPSEWDPTAEDENEDEDDEFELFSPGTGGLIVDTGDGRTYEAHETKAIQAAANYVDDNDDATVADLEHEVFPDHRARHGDPEEWWTETVGPGLREITDAEIPPEEPDDGAADDKHAGEEEPADGEGDRTAGGYGTERESVESEGSERFDHDVRGERSRGWLVEVSDDGGSAEFFVSDDAHGGLEVEPASRVVRGQGDEWIRDAKLYLREWWRATEHER